MLKCILTLLKKFNIIYINFNIVKVIVDFRGGKYGKRNSQMDYGVG